MTKSIVPVNQSKQLLFSKEAIKLPHKERLELLLKAKSYPVVKKRTSAIGQLKEMIDFYNLCCFMLAQYFSNEQADDNFVLLSFLASQESSQSIITEKLSKPFRLLAQYEELEDKISAIQMFFLQYEDVFPDLYSQYNLDEIATEKISDIIENSRKLIASDSSHIKKLMTRWELS